jgi:hypothetical protein
MKERIVQQKSPYVLVPQREGKAADKAFIGEVEALVVVVSATCIGGEGAVPEVEALVVAMEQAAWRDGCGDCVGLRPSARVVVYDVEEDCDAIDVEEIDHDLELGDGWGDVGERHGREVPGGEEAVDGGEIAGEGRGIVDRVVECWGEEVRALVAEAGIALRGRVLLLVDGERLDDVDAEGGEVG